MFKPWFLPKKFGYGLAPSGVAGWVCVIIFAAALSAEAYALRSGHLTRHGAMWAVMGTALVFGGLIWLTSDRKSWGWHWGSQT